MLRCISLILFALCGALRASPSKLIQAVDLPLVVEGKTVGSMKLPAGSDVEVVSVSGTNAVIRRGESTYSIDASNLPAPSEAQPTPTTTPQVALAAPTPSSVASRQAIKAGVSLSPSVDEVNACLGQNIFPPDGKLWSDGINYPKGPGVGFFLESKTSYEELYTKRSYSRANQMYGFNGEKVSHVLIRATNSTTDMISIFLNNKGNYSEDGLSKAEERVKLREERKEEKAVIFPTGYEKGIADQQPRLKQTLSTLFKSGGIPAKLWANSGLEENGIKWEWNDSVFFLSLHPKEYNALRILSKERFDALNNGAERQAIIKSREALSKRVVHLDDGTVTLSDFPFRNQGDRGYCTTTSFERVLKYNGIDRENDLLAIGTTGAGGGGQPIDVKNALSLLLNRYGIRMTHREGNGGTPFMKGMIDKGQPIIISKWANGSKRTGWTHCCCIVGYNDIKQSFFLSDSNYTMQRKQSALYNSGKNTPGGRWLSYKEAMEIIYEVTYIE